MTPSELRARTKAFAVAIVKLCRELPKDWHVRTIGSQLLRSATAVAANYRAACRARSDREFCSKIGLVLEEADESQLWLDLMLVAHPQLSRSGVDTLMRENAELTAIFTTSYKTAKENLRRRAEARTRGRRSTGEPIT